MNWSSTPKALRVSMEAAWRNGMPPVASALYGRWWQLETWLRSLVYVEFKAAFGKEWEEKIPQKYERRQKGEQDLGHMTTPDAGARLAYSDVSALFNLIDENWPLFESSLLAKGVWDGRVEELLKIRNRIGHCRRPHSDDLSRLEQTLRDFEAGAFTALTSFNRQYWPDKELDDDLLKIWGRGGTEQEYLIGHAERQYKTNFKILWSRRPWSEPYEQSGIEGKKGYIWHMCWYFREGTCDLKKLWRDVSSMGCQSKLIFICAPNPHSLQMSMPAIDAAQDIAKDLELLFDFALSSVDRHENYDTDWDSWKKRHLELDPIVNVNSPWSIVDDSTVPITIFSA